MIRQFKTKKEVCDFYKIKNFSMVRKLFPNKDILMIVHCFKYNPEREHYLVYENEIKTRERLTDVIHSLVLQNNLKDIFKEFRVSVTGEVIYCVYLDEKRVNEIKFSDVGVCDKLIFGRTKTRVVKFFTFTDLLASWRENGKS